MWKRSLTRTCCARRSPYGGEGGGWYLDVVVDCSVGGEHHRAVISCRRSLQTSQAVSVQRAGRAAGGPGQAGHALQGDGSLRAAQCRASDVLAAQSLIRLRAAQLTGQGPVGSSVPCCVCLAPRAPQGNGALQSDVGHAGDEVPQGGQAMVRRRPGIQLGKIRVRAKVPLQGKGYSLGPILQRCQRVVAQTAVLGALQHACRKTGHAAITSVLISAMSASIVGDELPGKSPVCDLNPSKAGSLIIEERGQRRAPGQSMTNKTCQRSDCQQSLLHTRGRT